MSAKEVMMEMNEYKAPPRVQVPQFYLPQQNGTRFKRGAASAAQCEGRIEFEMLQTCFRMLFAWIARPSEYLR
jgi:hypothetical protein